MIVKRTCPQCKNGKSSVLTKEYDIGNLHFCLYQCGHSSSRPQPKVSDFSDFASLDGHKPFKYQIEGAVFGQKAGRFLIADEMGLGKTIQAIMIQVKLGLKTLVICKSSLRIQWAREFYRWGNESLAQIIDSEKEFIVPGVNIYIVSMDLLRRFKDLEGWIKKLGVEFITLDEIQHLKNSDTARTNAVRTACTGVQYIAALSGTPVENNASEYFNILNLLRPDKFPSRTGYESRFVKSYWTGMTMKSGGLKNQEVFRDLTKDFIIRRRRADVMPDLPTVSRNFLFVDLGDVVKQAYKTLLEGFKNAYANTGSGGERQECILAYLGKMRHLTGTAKIDPTVEYIEDFLNNTDRKIVVFLHHQDISYITRQKLAKLSPVLDISDCHAEDRQRVIDEFKNNSYKRILVASTLASGEGLNLQFCSDCLHMERQWNPSKEEQAEGRFVRIGQTANAVNSTYPVAVGTIDEYLSELIERKRASCLSTLDGVEMAWNESSIMQELAEILMETGTKKWSW